MTERRSEDLTLDFKLAPSIFAGRDDRRTLAVAISGFANSNGGLIVWGIDARRDADGVDCAQAAVPIPTPDLFMSRLVDYAGRASSPAPDGVQHRLIEGAGGPFALTYVPESSAGPHMAKLGEDRYYKRSGGSFLVMEHFEVADMFGRRPRPILKVIFTPREGGATILVSIRNEGRGLARSPYLALEVPGAFRASQYGFDGNGSFGLPPIGRGGVRPCFGSQTDFVIHSGQTLDVTSIDAAVKTISGAAVAKGPVTFGYEIAAEGLPITRGTETFTFHER